MGRILLAFRAFYRVLISLDFANEVRVLIQPLHKKAVPASAPAATPPSPKAPPARSEALTLLSVLQREGRLIDFLKEDLSGYSDAQIGAAVRDVHRDSAAALERIFAIRPLRSEPEGNPVEVPTGFDPSAFRLTGNVTGQGPYRATLRHTGWQATKLDLPVWSGAESSSRIISAAEVEV